MNENLKTLVSGTHTKYARQHIQDFETADHVCELLNEMRDVYERWASERPENTRDRWLVGDESPYCYFAFWSSFDEGFRPHPHHAKVRIRDGGIHVWELGGGEKQAHDAIAAAAMVYDFYIKREAEQEAVKARRIKLTPPQYCGTSP